MATGAPLTWGRGRNARNRTRLLFEQRKRKNNKIPEDAHGSNATAGPRSDLVANKLGAYKQHQFIYLSLFYFIAMR